MIANEEQPNRDLTFFDKPGRCITTRPIKVFQALDAGYALATIQADAYEERIDVLLYNSSKQPYYDDQTIYIPKGSCARQLGVYKYQSRNKLTHTVPIVGIMK